MKDIGRAGGPERDPGHQHHPVSTLPDADRDVEELTLRLHELQREILTARLDVLEVLTQVSALVKPREPRELYTLAPP